MAIIAGTGQGVSPTDTIDCARVQGPTTAADVAAAPKTATFDTLSQQPTATQGRTVKAHAGAYPDTDELENTLAHDDVASDEAVPALCDTDSLTDPSAESSDGYGDESGDDDWQADGGGCLNLDLLRAEGPQPCIPPLEDISDEEEVPRFNHNSSREQTPASPLKRNNACDAKTPCFSIPSPAEVEELGLTAGSGNFAKPWVSRELDGFHVFGKSGSRTSDEKLYFARRKAWLERLLAHFARPPSERLTPISPMIDDDTLLTAVALNDREVFLSEVFDDAWARDSTVLLNQVMCVAAYVPSMLAIRRFGVLWANHAVRASPQFRHPSIDELITPCHVAASRRHDSVFEMLLVTEQSVDPLYSHYWDVEIPSFDSLWELLNFVKRPEVPPFTYERTGHLFHHLIRSKAIADPIACTTYKRLVSDTSKSLERRFNPPDEGSKETLLVIAMKARNVLLVGYACHMAKKMKCESLLQDLFFDAVDDKEMMSILLRNGMPVPYKRLAGAGERYMHFYRDWIYRLDARDVMNSLPFATYEVAAHILKMFEEGLLPDVTLDISNKIREADIRFLELMLRYPVALTESKGSMFHLALGTGRRDVIRLLLERNAVSMETKYGKTRETVFHYACKHCPPRVVEILVDWCVEHSMVSWLAERDNRGRDPLDGVKNREIRRLVGDGIAKIKQDLVRKKTTTRKPATPPLSLEEQTAVMEAAMASAAKGVQKRSEKKKKMEKRKRANVSLKQKLDQIAERIGRLEGKPPESLRAEDTFAKMLEKASVSCKYVEQPAQDAERIARRRERLVPELDDDDDLDENLEQDDACSADDNVLGMFQTKSEVFGTQVPATAAGESVSEAWQERVMKSEWISGACWEIVLTKSAIAQWRSLDKPMWMMVFRRLARLSRGQWSRTLAKRLSNVPASLKLFEAKFTKGGRIVWELTVDFSQRLSSMTSDKEKFIYCEIIRVWNISLDHDTALDCISRVVQNHKRSLRANVYRDLRLESPPVDSLSVGEVRQTLRLPRMYSADTARASDLGQDGITFVSIREMLPNDRAEAGNNDKIGTADAELKTKEVRLEQEQHAVHRYMVSDDAYTLEKFYELSSVMAQKLYEHCAKSPSPAANEANPTISVQTSSEEDQGFDYPFRPSEVEYKVICLNPDPPASILLLGRSGTGKTTCALFRMWHLYYKYWSTVKPNAPPYQGPYPELKPDCTHLHQIFITASPVLRSEVQRTFRGFLRSSNLRRTKHKSANLTSLKDVPEECFPLFLTSREWLMCLDATIRRPFFPRDESGRPRVKIVARSWISEDGGSKQLDAIPEMDLEHAYNRKLEFADDFGWPAAVTCEARDGGDIGLGALIRRATPEPSTEGTTGVVGSSTFVEVDYNYFLTNIWPNINSNGKSEFDPSMVFTEIFSFIKGSIEAMKDPRGHLTFEEYDSMGRKKSASFNNVRREVYDIFVEYEKYKKSKRHICTLYDFMDVVHHIYRNLEANGYVGTPLHSFIHDEVQDFTQAELRLDFLCCANPNALLFTGDTCQTIAKGIGFRFQDLTTVFFVESQLEASRRHRLSRNSRQLIVPKVQKLTQNFRAHSGILNMAACVVEILEEYFPWSLDILPKDSGVFNGPLPLLFNSEAFQDLSVLLYGDRPKEASIDFGAHQVILVRNQESKRKLPSEFRRALVMTIYEAKGLEFDDVLLYNFFKDSKATKEWRTVTAYQDRLESLPEYVHKAPEGYQRGKEVRPLEFEPTKHSILMGELKHLYTAVTRARVNLWLYDESTENRAPVFDYLQRRGVALTVDKSQLSDEGAGKLNIRVFPQKSSTEEWRAKGRQLFKLSLYETAARCFSISGDTDLEQFAKALALANGAKELQGAEREIQYVDAADLFSMLGQFEKAALCLYAARHYQMAARIFACLGMHAQRAIAMAGGQ